MSQIVYVLLVLVGKWVCHIFIKIIKIPPEVFRQCVESLTSHLHTLSGRTQPLTSNHSKNDCQSADDAG